MKQETCVDVLCHLMFLSEVQSLKDVYTSEQITLHRDTCITRKRTKRILIETQENFSLYLCLYNWHFDRNLIFICIWQMNMFLRDFQKEVIIMWTSSNWHVKILISVLLQSQATWYVQSYRFITLYFQFYLIYEIN